MNQENISTGGPQSNVVTIPDQQSIWDPVLWIVHRLHISQQENRGNILTHIPIQDLQNAWKVLDNALHTEGENQASLIKDENQASLNKDENQASLIKKLFEKISDLESQNKLPKFAVTSDTMLPNLSIRFHVKGEHWWMTFLKELGNSSYTRLGNMLSSSSSTDCTSIHTSEKEQKTYKIKMEHLKEADKFVEKVFKEIENEASTQKIKISRTDDKYGANIRVLSTLMKSRADDDIEKATTEAKILEEDCKNMILFRINTVGENAAKEYQRNKTNKKFKSDLTFLIDQVKSDFICCDHNKTEIRIFLELLKSN